VTGSDSVAAERIAGLLRDSLGVEVPGWDTDLFETGVLDSLMLISLLTEIETAFSFELPLDDLDLEHFASIDRMASYVDSVNRQGA